MDGYDAQGTLFRYLCDVYMITLNHIDAFQIYHTGAQTITVYLTKLLSLTDLPKCSSLSVATFISLV